MSIRTAALAAVCAFALLGAGPAAAVSLTPLPQSVTEQEGALPVAGRFVVTWTGCREPMLDRAAERFRCDFFAGDRLDDLRPGDEHLARFLHHEDPVSKCRGIHRATG